MPRFKLILEYDGAPFVGWQRQENGLSIQEALEEALAAMTGERATVHGAGRTDAGVHALGQVAHVDLEREWEPFRLGEGLNALLHPHPIAVLKSERVDSGFDARRSASARHYLYRIVNRRAPLALERGG
jgi:tRNA pseudouridine38-40 synthase